MITFLGVTEWLWDLSMSWRLCALEQVYHETKIGRELTDDEQLERFTNWGIGVNEETLNAYYSTCGRQQEEAEQDNQPN